MKTGSSKTPMLVSTAAAAHLFIIISSMDIDPAQKCDLLTLVSDIINGYIDITEASFPEEAEEVRSYLIKAIRRSAKARAAAARRRSAVDVVSTARDCEVTPVSDASIEIDKAGTVAEDNHEEVVAEEKEDKPEEPLQPAVNHKKRRRRRRRHH
ncbi:MAG: hypothetical protein K2K55_03215 [Duncaniella sp.]|nr:hypothetical protein [Duncaniella sp.]